jgi:hypothetical protein
MVGEECSPEETHENCRQKPEDQKLEGSIHGTDGTQEKPTLLNKEEIWT